MLEIIDQIRISPIQGWSLLFMVLTYLGMLVFPGQKKLLFSLLGSSSLLMLVSRWAFGGPFLAAWMVAIALLLWGAKYNKSRLIRLAALYGFFVVSWVGVLHLIPFYGNFRLLGGVQVSPKSYPYTLFYNFDKAFVCALIFLGLLPYTGLKNKKKSFLLSLGLGALACLVLYPLAFYWQFVEWDIKWKDFTVVWIVINSLFVCFAEEIFFRGFILDYFTERCFFFVSKKERLRIGFVVSTVLFALYHYRLGWTYMVLACIAGAFYGWTYLRTRSVYLSSIPHIMVNLFHFILFSYPTLR